jgi:putative nucleotidyltransferase with HDIG domain
MNTTTAAATIMVVDDETAVRELLVLALEANEFETIAAGNCADALTGLQSRHVDLLLLDLKLGQENGIELLKAVRRLPGYEKLPIILLTGCASREIVLEAAQLKVQGYILKHQFSRKDLTARIDQLLKKRETESPPPAADVTAAAALAMNEAQCTATTLKEPTRVKFPPRNKVVENPADAELPKDAPNAELLRTVKPVLTRSQVLEQVDRFVELKALPPTVSQLLSVTSDPDCSIDQIARIVKIDQVMTLKILKIANSVIYGYAGSVDTVQQALLRIGVTQVRQLVLGIGVIESFRTTSLGEHFNARLFWEHSIATGLIAASIAKSRDGDKHAIDLAFTIGLLHDVTRMVLVEQFDDIYKRVLDTAARLQLPLEQVESRMLLINHADVANRLLNAWNFPKRLIEAITMHHLSASEIASLQPQKRSEVGTLVLANQLAHALLLGSSGNNGQNATEELVQLLELKPDAIRRI